MHVICWYTYSGTVQDVSDTIGYDFSAWGEGRTSIDCWYIQSVVRWDKHQLFCIHLDNVVLTFGNANSSYCPTSYFIYKIHPCGNWCIQTNWCVQIVTVGISNLLKRLDVRYFHFYALLQSNGSRHVYLMYKREVHTLFDSCHLNDGWGFDAVTDWRGRLIFSCTPSFILRQGVISTTTFTHKEGGKLLWYSRHLALQ